MSNRLVSLYSALVLTFIVNPYGLSMAPAVAETTSADATADHKSGPQKRALLIGVSKYNYDDKHTEDDLNTDADVAAIEAVLESPKYGFSKKDITVLNAPETTTRESILAAINKLIEDTGKGDLVYFHYSGHGSTVPDPTHHKFSDVDQTLVPHDYDTTLPPPCNEIKDTDLHELVIKLMKKEPLLVTMSFDCCYSGGITRGRHKVRGFRYPGKVTSAGRGDKTASANSAIKTIADSTPDNFVVLAACRPDQEAGETDAGNSHSMGLFTSALAQALAHATAQTAYRDLMDQVGAVMAMQSDSGQTPQCEGQLDNILMSGTVLPAQPSIAVQVMPDSRLVLKAGELQNMTLGSVFDLYPAETKDFSAATPFASAKISAVRMIESDLDLGNTSIDLTKFALAKAREKTHAYTGDKLNLVLQGLDKTTADYILSGLKASDAFVISVAATAEEANKIKWNVRITGKKGATHQLSLEREEGGEFASAVVSADDDGTNLSALKKRLEAELRWRFVKSLKNTSDTGPTGLELRLVPVVVTSRDKQGHAVDCVDKPGWTGANTTGPIALNENDSFMIEVRNRGQQAVYFYVMDLQPDGLIGPVYPNPKRNIKVDENKISADAHGNWIRVQKPYIFTVKGPTFGKEILKIIGTTEPTDFTPLFNTHTRGADARALSNPIAKLLRSVNAGERCIEMDASVGDWTASEVMMETKKEKD